MSDAAPDIEAIRALRQQLGESVYRTPMLRCAAIESALDGAMEVHAKLEFLQRTGTFKARGALATVHSLTPAQLSAGVTAVSAGNHAIATAYAARTLGTSAKVVMLKSASPVRVARCQEYGAEVVLAENVHEAFTLAERIRAQEGRYFVHPFEGPAIALGTGTIGLEISEQLDDFDAVVVPVGGGGLIGGIANAIKQLRPGVEVIGVEPEGADTMHRSFAAGSPQSIERVTTIADSLGAPFALEYSFGLCRANVDRLTMIDDLALRRGMGFLFRSMKIAVEPACAATTAALLGPLRESLAGKRVVIIFCGSNIDWDTFERWALVEEDAA